MSACISASGVSAVVGVSAGPPGGPTGVVVVEVPAVPSWARPWWTVAYSESIQTGTPLSRVLRRVAEIAQEWGRPVPSPVCPVHPPGMGVHPLTGAVGVDVTGLGWTSAARWVNGLGLDLSYSWDVLVAVTGAPILSAPVPAGMGLDRPDGTEERERRPVRALPRLEAYASCNVPLEALALYVTPELNDALSLFGTDRPRPAAGLDVWRDGGQGEELVWALAAAMQVTTRFGWDPGAYVSSMPPLPVTADRAWEWARLVAWRPSREVEAWEGEGGALGGDAVDQAPGRLVEALREWTAALPALARIGEPPVAAGARGRVRVRAVEAVRRAYGDLGVVDPVRARAAVAKAGIPAWPWPARDLPVRCPPAPRWEPLSRYFRVGELDCLIGRSPGPPSPLGGFFESLIDNPGGW